MLIRPAVAGDAEAIRAIVGPVIRAGDTYALDPEMGDDAALAWWTAPDKTIFVAEPDGAIAGTYYLRANHGGAGAHVANCGYMTSEAARGRGVSRAMCEHSLDAARACGFRAMQFNFVVSSNFAAVTLWTSAGFEIVGRLPGAFVHPVHGSVDALVMYRNL